MCGIYAILNKKASSLSASDLDVFSQMAILTQLRGIHNSGVFALDGSKPKASAKILKCIGPSGNLIYEKGWEAWWKYAGESASALVGHGRHATVGKITKANAHPFKHEHITMVHNGTIRGGLDKEHEAEVDSHQLCKQMAADGIEEALRKAFGAFAVVAHDEEKGQLFIVRNSERPLHYIEGANKIYIMSEQHALDYLYKRSAAVQHGTIKEFLANQVYIFDFESGELAQEGNVVKKPVVYKPSYKEFPFRHESGGSSTNSSSKGTTFPALKYPTGSPIVFEVKRILDPLPDTKDYTYLCLDPYGNTVFFKTDKRDEKLIDSAGIGVCCFSKLVPENNRWIYQVRFREIKWKPADDIPTPDHEVCIACGGTGKNSKGHVCQACDGTGFRKAPQAKPLALEGPNYAADEEEEDEDLVLMQDGDVFPKSRWLDLCKSSTCSICRESVSPEDNEETLVWENGGQMKMICKHCIKEHMHDTARSYSSLIARVMQ